MKTFELKMNRSRWISILIALLCVALIIMMLSPYFTYGKSATVSRPSEGTKDSLFGRTWIKNGTKEGDENYEALVITKDGKNSTYITTNKLRYNQQYAAKVFEDALENYRVMKNNLEAAKAYENETWNKYEELGATCNSLAASMNMPTFTLKDRAATQAAEEATEEEAAEGESTEAAESEEAAEEDIKVEGDFADQYKTLNNAMKAANRAVDNASKARAAAEAAYKDAEKAVNDAYKACLVAYAYGEDGKPLENGIDPAYAMAKVDSAEYNKIMTEKYEDDYINAVLAKKDKDYKDWLIKHPGLYKKFAESLGITKEDVLNAAAKNLLADENSKAELKDKFIADNQSAYDEFVKNNAQAITDDLFATLAGEVTTEEYADFTKANAEDYAAYLTENRETLKTKLYDDLNDKTRTRANYLASLRNILYRDFVMTTCADEFRAFVLDESKKQNITDSLYGNYIEGTTNTLYNDLYNEFVTTKKEAEFKDYLTDLAIKGADGELKTSLEAAATTAKADLLQGNTSLMYADYANANEAKFHEFIVDKRLEGNDDAEGVKENAAIKLFTASKADAFSAWIDGLENGVEVRDAAYTSWIATKKIGTKDKTNFYNKVFSKLSADEKKAYNKEFFESVKDGLNDKDKEEIYKNTKTAILERMSNEDLDKEIYSQLNDMLSRSNSAYKTAANAAKLVTSSAKAGKDSNTSKKASKQADAIVKQIDKVSPIDDEINGIKAKNKAYDELMKGDEEAKEAAYEKFIADKQDLLYTMLLKKEAEATKTKLYTSFEEVVNGENVIDTFDTQWKDTAQAEYIQSRLDALDEVKDENGVSDLDKLYEEFILTEHNDEFKQWLYDESLKAASEADDSEEGKTEEKKAAKKAEKTTVNVKEVDAKTIRAEFLGEKPDPAEMEKETKASATIETPVTVAYTAGKEENDPASLTITFANGDVKKTTFDNTLSYDKVQKISILGFLAFPDDFAEDFETPVANYQIKGYSRNSVVLLPILLFILLIVCIVLAIIKRDSYVSGILPVVTGIIGVLAFLFNTFLKLGDWPIAFVICFAVLLCAGACQIYLFFAGKKGADQPKSI